MLKLSPQLLPFFALNEIQFGPVGVIIKAFTSSRHPDDPDETAWRRAFWKFLTVLALEFAQFNYNIDKSSHTKAAGADSTKTFLFDVHTWLTST